MDNVVGMKKWVLTKEFPRESRITIIDFFPTRLVSIDEKRRWVNERLTIKMVLIHRNGNEIIVENYQLFDGPKEDA